jgi:LemA protein
MRTLTILAKLYGIRPRKARRWGALATLPRRAAAWVHRYNWRLTFAAAAIAVWIATHLYYFNWLTALQFDVKAAWAQVEVGKQKRAHIQRNLSRVLRYYASYERRLMTNVTQLRTDGDAPERGATEGEPGGGLDGLLGRLNAVAEQYPELQLTNSAQQFSEAIIATETDITDRIREYNTAVNTYTSVLNQFPGNLFGKVAGFEEAEFYSPNDPSVLEYQEVEL